ncbi:MAG TPA: HD domain-containing protein [Acidimicrobiales bacterium]|nr:HD domain-containing protein [Acidimicrobiales bacterium]
MSGADRRHAVAVARDVRGRLGSGAATPPVLAAALLHDVGKIEAGLGTLARVPATLAGLLARDRLVRGNGRVSRYLRHDAAGAALLEGAGADRLVVAWAREHHLPPDRWSVPREVGDVLKAADDD